MATTVDLCEIKGEFTLEWKIKDFFSLSDEENIFYYSPKFYFSDASWSIKIFPHGETKFKSGNSVGIYLERKSIGNSATLKCTLGFKAADGGTVSKIEFTRTYHEKDAGYGAFNFISRSTLLEKKAELLPFDTLTVVCSLLNSEANGITASYFDRLQNVCDTCLDIYKKEKRTDLLLKLDGGDIRAHRMILETRSPVFAAMFSHDTKENQTGEVSVKDVDRNTMDAILYYMYSGDLEKLTTKNVLSIYAAAEKYDVKEVKQMCIKFILRNLSVEWVCDVIKFAKFYQVEEIVQRAREFFKENAKKILETETWETFSKENHDIGVELLATTVKALLPD